MVREDTNHDDTNRGGRLDLAINEKKNSNMIYDIKQLSPQLLVSDLNRSIDFYTKTLGFKIDFLYEDFYCGISKDGYSVHLKLAQPNSEERKARREGEYNDIIIAVEGIDNLYKNILDSAVEIIQPLRAMPYGNEFYIADPDGYIISFIEEK